MVDSSYGVVGVVMLNGRSRVGSNRLAEHVPTVDLLLLMALHEQEVNHGRFPPPIPTPWQEPAKSQPSN